MYWLKKVWKNLTAPHPRIKDEEERINSRLLSTLMVIILPMGGLFLAIIPFIIRGEFFINIDFIIFGSMLLTLTGAYWINRKGHLLTAFIFILFVGGFFIFLEGNIG